MTDPTVRLTDEDRAALFDAACPAHSGPADFVCRPCANTQDALIERILARHVAEAEARGGREAGERIAQAIEAHTLTFFENDGYANCACGEWGFNDVWSESDARTVWADHLRATIARAADPAPEGSES